MCQDNSRFAWTRRGIVTVAGNQTAREVSYGKCGFMYRNCKWVCSLGSKRHSRAAKSKGKIMLSANSFSEIDEVSRSGIALAAEDIEQSVSDLEKFFIDGGDWDAETPEELADLIATCWLESTSE